jgi:hypothetical protein
MLGKLSWSAIPFDQPIPLVASLGVILVLLGVFAWITVKGHWGYLWREWITSVDHKRIGVMYMALGGLMLLRGFIDAVMMRSQQLLAINAPGYLPPEHYNQIFTAHGTISWSTSPCSSASSPAPAGCPIRRCRSRPTRPASASTITCGPCRSRGSGRC